MPYTQADADNLRAAIASGAKTVRMNDREYQYQSISQMRAALSDIQQSINDAARTNTGRKRRGRNIRVRHGRGL